jgi:hypothetical protein
MSNNSRTALAAGLIVGLMVLSAGVRSDVAGYSDGDRFLSSPVEFKYGYIGGAIDMLVALQDAELLKPGEFSAQVAKVVSCTKDRTLSDIADIYAQYLKLDPDKAKDIAATSIYYAAKAACKV